jgi:DNA-binding CsgD family transcriptional regulator
MHLELDNHTVIAARWIAAYNARNVDALCELAHVEIELAPTTSYVALPGSTYRGHTGVRALLAASFAKFPHIRVELVEARQIFGWLLATTTFRTGPPSDPGPALGATYLMTFEHGRIRRLHTFLTDSDAVAAADGAVLTPRERQVFQLLAGGLRAPEVARELYLSPATVRTHVQNGIARLGARTRVQAVALALTRGEIDL